MKTIKQALILLLMLLYCVSVKSHSFMVGGIYYNITDYSNKTVGVTYRGYYYDDYSNEYTDSVTIPESVTYNGTTYSVTSIRNEAFNYCESLTSVTIPNSVTSIGDYAFQFCEGLTSVTIGNSVTSIGDYAFRYCYGLTSIEIPNSVTNIGDYAFSNTPLTSVTIGNSVTSIGDRAFSSCSKLKTVINLSNLTFNKGSNDYGFVAYYANKVINAPNGFIDGDFVFFRPNGVNTLAAYLGSATELTLPAHCDGESYVIDSYAFEGCSGLTSIVIPNSVTSIGDYAFSGTPLTSVIIGNSVTSIGDYAFTGCSGLTSITIPNSVTSIGRGAFYDCSNLTSIQIGSGVENIYQQAFTYCKKLTDVYCLGTTVPNTKLNAFEQSDPKDMTLHVPAEAINNYKTTAPWNSFGTIIAISNDETPVCATPQISYCNGKLSIDCDTEGAEFVTDITSNDFGKFYSNNIKLSATYNICVYATATGYENSETLNATLCWIENGESEGSTTGIINTPATAALITYTNGTLAISCSLNGETVVVYTTDGVLVGTTTIENGSATIATGLSKDTIVIVKIGEKSIKIIMQ